MSNQSDSADAKNFAVNLKFLCGFYSSISEVCRRLEINRQQFNRYLSGKSFPSYKNYKKICDFFGVESEEIIIDPIEFKKMAGLPSASEKKGAVPEQLANIVMPLMKNSSQSLSRYEGYYYRYFYSFSFPGYIFRSFLKLYQLGDYYYIKHIELSSKNDALSIPRLVIKYHGIVFFLAERIFIVESEPALNSTISEAILTPNYRPNSPYMSGLVICASSGSSHQPSAGRTVFEFLGKNINIRAAMKQCDLFHHTDERIPENIKNLIKNEISDAQFTFHPQEFL